MGDRLVSLADKVWKNKRVPDPENLIVAQVAAISAQPDWKVFLALDDLPASFGDAAAPSTDATALLDTAGRILYSGCAGSFVS